MLVLCLILRADLTLTCCCETVQVPITTKCSSDRGNRKRTLNAVLLLQMTPALTIDVSYRVPCSCRPDLAATMARVKSLSSSEKVLRNEPDFYTIPGGGQVGDDAPPWLPPSLSGGNTYITSDNNNDHDHLSIIEPTPIAPQHRHTQSAPSLAMNMMPAPDAAASSSMSLPPMSSLSSSQQPFVFGNSMQGQGALFPSTGPAFFEAFFREGFMSNFMAPSADPSSHSNPGVSFQSVMPSHQVRDHVLANEGFIVTRASERSYLVRTHQALPMTMADNTMALPNSSSSSFLHDHLLLWQAALQRLPEEKLDVTTSRSSNEHGVESSEDQLKVGANDDDWKRTDDSLKRRQSPIQQQGGAAGSATKRSNSNVSDRRSESEESGVGTEAEESSTNMMTFLHDVDLGSSDDDGGGGGGRS